MTIDSSRQQGIRAAETVKDVRYRIASTPGARLEHVPYLSIRNAYSKQDQWPGEGSETRVLQTGKRISHLSTRLCEARDGAQRAAKLSEVPLIKHAVVEEAVAGEYVS